MESFLGSLNMLTGIYLGISNNQEVLDLTIIGTDGNSSCLKTKLKHSRRHLR
jgi:hypothetical protein